jgi:hypothetical protein
MRKKTPTLDNPESYRGYEISAFRADFPGPKFVFIHASDFGLSEPRMGYALTIDACKREIDFLADQGEQVRRTWFRKAAAALLSKPLKRNK